MVQVHASCVEVEGIAVLLRGPAGSGKSDLALRLIEGGGRLVADDRAVLTVRKGRIVVSAPPEIAGLIEVRGLGVLRIGGVEAAPLGLVVDLVAGDHVERLPAPASWRFRRHRVALIRLQPFEASAAAKVRLAARRAAGHIMAAR